MGHNDGMDVENVQWVNPFWQRGEAVVVLVAQKQRKSQQTFDRQPGV